MVWNKIRLGLPVANSTPCPIIGLRRALWPRTDLESGHWEDFMLTRDQARRLRAAFLDKRTDREQVAKETCNGNGNAGYSPKNLMGGDPI